MNFLYTLLLFLHILSAVLSIGPFFVLFPVIRQMKTAEREVLAGHLTTFRGAVRLVKHAGHILVTTGMLLVWLSAWPWYTSWVVLTLAVMVGSVFFLANAFKPVLKKFEVPDADQPALTAKLTRSVWLYISLLLVMLWLMVDKPMLW
ncbi:DUF2269 family protein [Planococcus lenghuensis]|uniref:DUF2269 family protein n=1 Tax=Planococcus lenghuensis TaxID=2213202 RepID=A0A1Q2L3F6_9BACL|nr:DUF2269 family protein [Planococcus lenghuensis]AQQ54946.1 hypothetical protein B0X71_01215 [Planococcus lenghuensis]